MPNKPEYSIFQTLHVMDYIQVPGRSVKQADKALQDAEYHNTKHGNNALVQNRTTFFQEEADAPAGVDLLFQP